MEWIGIGFPTCWEPYVLHRHRPAVLLFQWWTGAVLHSYVLLALVARLQGARIIIEIHEIQDTGEAKLTPVRSYVQRFGRWLMGMADAYIVHSEFDRVALGGAFDVGQRPIRVVGMDLSPTMRLQSPVRCARRPRTSTTSSSSVPFVLTRDLRISCRRSSRSSAKGWTAG